MTTITEQLFDALKNVQSPGDFYAAGTLDTFLPSLEVEGVGRIALPLLPIQAQQLIAVAEQAPYGLGQETLVDTNVRRTWQIDASKLTLGGKHWQESLQAMVSRVATGLGVSGEVKAELYKLLLYDAGSFFIRHRDTEKAAGMFATLVIGLPSTYSGGELVVKHQQQQVTLDLRCDDAAEIGFAAFYADCVHEILPVTDGYRLTLIYNLLRTDKKLPLPKPPDYRQEQTHVASLLQGWAKQISTDSNNDQPEKLIYLLEHAYTPAELSFTSLKNVDAAVADVLIAAAEQAQCDIHLALVSVEENGIADYASSGRWDDGEWEIGEINERTETVSEWRRIDGEPSSLPTLPFSAEEFCPPSAFEGMETDDVEFHEATGNEGASFERSYSYAALVIWPKARHLAIINQADFRVTLPILADFCQRWEAEGSAPHSNLWNDAHTLAEYMLRDWLPKFLGKQTMYSRDTSAGMFLNYLYRLRDSQLLSDFWSLIAINGIYHKELGAALVQASDLLPWTDVVNWTESAINISAQTAQEACADLLARLSMAKPVQAKDLNAAAHTLFKMLPGDPKRFPQLTPYEVIRVSATPGLVVDVLASFSAIDAALAEDTFDYMLAWPATYDADKILLPAALTLTETSRSRMLPVVVRLREAVQTHLNRRVAEALEPPQDWRRDSQIKCRCEDCRNLSIFLDSPTQSEWTLRAAEAKRSHVESSIRGHACDVDCVTVRRGSPHSLVCTKNQASYQRRVNQRKQDLDSLARLAVE